MDCNNICKQAQKIITKYVQEHGTDKELVLVMQVKEIIDSEMDFTKKIQYQPHT